MTIDVSEYGRLPVGELVAQALTHNLPIDHWSPSSLAMFQRCPYQWQQRYIHGIKARPAEAPVTGTVVHAAIERNFAQKIASHEDLGIVELLDWYAEDAFPRIALEEQERSGMEILWDTTPDKARARGRVMLSEYHGNVAPRIQPEAVELRIAVDFGLGVPVEGRFDVDRPVSVIDVKTGRQARKTPKEDWNIQAAVYAKARNKPVEFHSVGASPKTNSVKIYTPLEEEALLVHPTVAQRDELARSLQAIARYACFLMSELGPDEPWPTLGRFHTWACGWCGYRSGCPAWKE